MELAERVRSELVRLVGEYGHSLLDEPRRCEGLLRDACGEHKREIFAIVSAVEEQVPAKLVPGSTAQSLLWTLQRLARQIQANRGLERQVAVWGVESVALALGYSWPETAAGDRPSGSAEALARVTPSVTAEAIETDHSASPSPERSAKVYCRNCRHANHSTARYCVGCGNVLFQDQVSEEPLVGVPTRLAQSIVATLLCFPPTGILAIIDATRVRERLSAQDYEGALQASRNAGFWSTVSVFLGLVLWLVIGGLLL